MPAIRANNPPYGSANDLPTVIELRKATKGLKLLARVVARGERKRLEQAERDLNVLVDLVDEFYRTLGPHHWIFTDHLLPVDDLRELFDRRLTSEMVEDGLIKLIAECVESPHWDLGLLTHEAMRARRPSLERAREHYVSRQWDSCALILITVMDGFVNDVETATRRGLHAREPEEMVAWDSVSGHHMGLTSVMREFHRPFRKRHDAEVFDVYRHGIIHGVVINYNNRVVATKAWNMLAAVTDWAASKEKSGATAEPRTSLRELWATLSAHGAYDRYRKNFESQTLSSADPGFEGLQVVIATRAFLESWQLGRWALVGEFFPSAAERTTRAASRAVEAKASFATERPSAFSICQVDFPMASVAVTTGMATVSGISRPISIRWILESATGRVATPDDADAKWVLAVATPHAFFTKN